LQVLELRIKDTCQLKPFEITFTPNWTTSDYSLPSKSSKVGRQNVWQFDIYSAGHIFARHTCTDPYARFCGQTGANGLPLTRWGHISDF
jgi:hypothetical protein